MASQTDDVGALFKSIGGDRNSYRELTRSAEAADSEERWPLLKAIPPERREAPPALSDLHKNQIWKSESDQAQRPLEAPRARGGLGEKLARSLMKITEGNLPFATANAAGRVAPAMRAQAAYPDEAAARHNEQPQVVNPLHAQPVPQQFAQPAPQQFAQPAPQYYAQPTPQHYPQPAPQHYPQPAPQHYAQPAPQQYGQPEPQPHPFAQPAPQYYEQPEPQYYEQPQPQYYEQPEPQYYEQPEPQYYEQPEPQQYAQPRPRERRHGQAQFGVPAAAAQHPSAAPMRQHDAPPMGQGPRMQRTPAPAQAPLFQGRGDPRGPAYAPPQGRANTNDRHMFSERPTVQSRSAESGRAIFGGYEAPPQSAREMFASEQAPQPTRQGGKPLFARDSLDNIFRSIEGDNDPAPTSGSRKALLGRLNRR